MSVEHSLDTSKNHCRSKIFQLCLYLTQLAHLTGILTSFLYKKRKCELVIFLYVQDLSGLEVTGKGQPFASVSAEPLPRSTSSEESEIL